MVKDLKLVDQAFNLAKVIIIDNLAESFQFQPMNGIKIKSWYGENEDNELPYYMRILEGKTVSGLLSSCRYGSKKGK